MKDETFDIENLKNKLPDEEKIIKLSDFFSVFGDSTRMQIVSLLRIQEMSVSDIAEVLEISVSAISHQLRTLKSHDLVRSRRKGKYSFYYLSDDHVTSIFDQGLSHLEEKYNQ